MTGRRQFIATGIIAGALLSSRSIAQDAKPVGSEHYTTKKTPDGDVRLFIWRKKPANASKGAILWVHGSSVQSVPVFDLQIPGKPEYSVMDWFSRLGYDNWCFDCEGYGRSDKKRPINADVATGADDIAAVVEYMNKNGVNKICMYGSSSGALRAGLYAQRHPEHVARLALDALTYTGEGSPTLADRRKNLPKYKASNRRPINRAFVRSIFTRDGHGDAADPVVVEAFADAVLALDDSMPTGTYIDMTEKLPLVEPAKLRVPTLIMRGQWDGIATFEDVVDFFVKLPDPDKQLTVMPGAHTSMRSRNWQRAYHVLDTFFARPGLVYTGS
jgi:alpha-beta hydrolase superfamily lysophospholipase